MGAMYAWATPDYLLDYMSFDQILLYYDYGLEHEENKSNILVSRMAVGLFGAKEKPDPRKRRRQVRDQTPDKKKFYEKYGDRIKRPEGEKTT